VIRPPALFGISTSSHLVAKQEEPVKDMNFVLRSIFVHTSKGFLTYRVILRRGAEGFTSPPKEGVLRICIAIKHL
jgi:hypothetical protein